MERPLITIHNLETNEIIEREYNDIELANYQKRLEQEKIENKIKEKIAADKANAIAKLAALGLTEDEVKAIIGV